jgi:phage host-nuclease inhibitor protein Gam
MPHIPSLIITFDETKKSETPKADLTPTQAKNEIKSLINDIHVLTRGHAATIKKLEDEAKKAEKDFDKQYKKLSKRLESLRKAANE